MGNIGNNNRNFSEKMRNFRKDPPPEIWNDIRKSLNEEKKSRLIPVFWKYAAGILILIGVGTTIWLSNNEKIFQNENIVVDDRSAKPDEKPENQARENNKSGDSKNETAPEALQNTDYEAIDTKKVEDREEKPADRSLKSAGMKNMIARQLDDQGESERSEAPFSNNQSLENDLNKGSIPVVAIIHELPRQIDPLNKSESSLKREVQYKREYTWEDLKTEELAYIQNEEEKKRKNKLLLGANISPLYTYRDLGNISPAMNEVFNESESGKITYSGGFSIGIQAGKKLSFHTGLSYSRLGIGVHDIYAIAEVRNNLSEDAWLEYNTDAASAYLVNNSIGSIKRGGVNEFNKRLDYESQNLESANIQPASFSNYLDAYGLYNPASNYVEEEGSLDQYFQYLELPFLMKYKVVERAFDLSILGGLSTNFLINSRVFFTKDGNSDLLGTTSDIERINYSSSLGLGVGYDLTEQFRFLFEPKFKYYLNSINSSRLIGTRPYSFGLYTGILYQF
jgi:hypothetical protein